MINKYKHNIAPNTRLIVVVENNLIEQVDRWGLSNGMTRRTATIKALNQGLDIKQRVAGQHAVGSKSPATINNMTLARHINQSQRKGNPL